MTRSKTNKSKSAASAKKRTIRRNNLSTSRRRKQITSKQKLTLYLNEALAIENATVQRLQSRIKHTKIEDAKQRLQLHLEETRGQQDRLKQLILNLGEKGVTKDKAQLPITTPPKSLVKTVEKMLTPAELELKAAKEDAIIENAEIILYDMLTQLAVKMNALMQYLFLHKSYQKKDPWLIGSELILLLWLRNCGLKLNPLLS